MWGRIDDKLHSHPKFCGVSLEASGLWLLCVSWSCDYGTDGKLPIAQITRFAGTKAKKIAKELVDAGLWEIADGGFLVHDFLKYHEPSEQYQARAGAKTAARSEAGRAGGVRSGEARRNRDDSKPEAKHEAKPKQNRSKTEPPNPNPNPYAASGIDAAARGALTGDFIVDTLAQFPHWEATLEERVASVKPSNPNGFRVTVLRGWVASPEKAPPLPYVPAELTLADDWKPGDRVEICPGVFAVASHAKDHRAPLGTLRFPGTEYSRSECRDKQETPSFSGRNVSTMDGASITPVPGWVCIVDRSWYTVGDNPGDPPRRCDGAGNPISDTSRCLADAAPVAVPLSPPKPFVKPGGAVLSC